MLQMTIEDSLVFNAQVFLHTLKEENSPSSAAVIVNTLLAAFFLPGTIGNLKPVNIIIFQAVFLMVINQCCLTCADVFISIVTNIAGASERSFSVRTSCVLSTSQFFLTFVDI